MAKTYVTQEVYDNMKGIASDKNEYEYLDSVGATEQAKKYSVAAQPKYSVVQAYSPDLFNTLKNSNSAQARDLLKNYAVARDEKTILKDIAMGKNGYETVKAAGGDYKPYEANTAEYYNELTSVNPTLAARVKDMSYDQLNTYINTGVLPSVPVAPTASARTKWDMANDIIGYKLGYEKGMANGVVGFDKNHYNAQPVYEELKKIDPSLAAALEGMNAEEAAAYIAKNKPATPMDAAGMYNDTHNEIVDYGDTYQNNMQKMYFDDSYGQEIRDNFNVYGGAKANQAAANAASDNGGNFDSFSDYNKNAMNMSYKIAGENAIENKRRGYADSATKFLDVWGNLLVGNADNFGDYDFDTRKLASDERIAQMQRDADIYSYDTERYKIDTEKEKWDAEMRKNGFNPDGTPIAGTASGVNYLGTGLSGIVSGNYPVTSLSGIVSGNNPVTSTGEEVQVVPIEEEKKPDAQDEKKYVEPFAYDPIGDHVNFAEQVEANSNNLNPDWLLGSELGKEKYVELMQDSNLTEDKVINAVSELVVNGEFNDAALLGEAFFVKGVTNVSGIVLVQKMLNPQYYEQ